VAAKVMILFSPCEILRKMHWDLELEEKMMGLCKICDLCDWENEDFLSILDDLHLSFGRENKHRKHWEFAQAFYGLKRLNCLTPEAIALGVGTGCEHPIYYLANVIAKVHATDLYGQGGFAQTNAFAEMLVHPEKFAPFPYREERLVTQYMDGCDLKYPNNCFDIVFSFSSIEHFGSHEASSKAVQGMARVLRPGGIAVITTEVILNKIAHPEFFLPDELYDFLIYPSGLNLVEEIDFTISPSLLENPVDLSKDHSSFFPHIVCQAGEVVFTSVLMFLQKPLDDKTASTLSHVLVRKEPTPPPTPQDLTAFLGLTADPQYAAERTRLRQSILERLEGCSPEGATPAEMAGYIGEAALRFGATIELLQQYVARGAQGQLLEIGSNPYFLTLLLKESFPALACMGVNYFAGGFPPQSMQQQAVIDPCGRLREVTFFHADVERHSLEALGAFDACLFCEVLEHLPFDPAWALFNIVRTLRPGGLLLLTTPNPARLENLEKMIRHRATFSDSVSGYGIHGRHNREYAASELIELCAAIGLTVLEAQTIDVVPTLYARDTEAQGYGAYHMLVARLDEPPRLVRPPWLYRSFTPERLASSMPLTPGG
jgi:SAM-dependent methyltransferase